VLRIAEAALDMEDTSVYLGFRVLTTASMKASVFWVVAPCSGISLPQ
jgi:hypothetical protein